MLASQNQATQVLPSPHQVRAAAVQNVPHSVVHLPHVPVQKLSICQVQTTSIPPKPVYHPAIIRACLSMFDKKPSELNYEEIRKFNEYRGYKKMKGEEIESDILYNPAGGNQPCLHCGHPTWCLICRVSPSIIFKGVFSLLYCMCVVPALLALYTFLVNNVDYIYYNWEVK